MLFEYERCCIRPRYFDQLTGEDTWVWRLLRRKQLAVVRVWTMHTILHCELWYVRPSSCLPKRNKREGT